VDLADWAERVCVQYSHPKWLAEAFRAELGESGAEALLRANNEIPPITARVNTLKTDVDAVLAELGADGAEARRHPWARDFVELRGGVERLKAFQNGHIFIQDAGAALAVSAAGVKPGDTVLDGCAAPGGKSFSAAMDMRGAGRIIACDLPKKAETIAAGAARLGVACIEAHARDARERAAEWVGVADAVLADVPCSGFGVIRKKPEIRYKSREEIAPLPEKQLELLRNLAEYVKPGGVLLYATCTLLRAENQGVVGEFLAGNGAFAPEAFTLPVGGGETGMATLLPHTHGTDGFFICKMRKRA
jgi:16S rRNA (cytosine967-C5)-methyltransferase